VGLELSEKQGSLEKGIIYYLLKEVVGVSGVTPQANIANVSHFFRSLTHS